MNNIPNRFAVQLFIFLALALFILATVLFRTGDSRTQLAEESYRQGESSTVIADRKEAFNKALDLFLKLDGDYHPHFGNGKLSYDIGNTYFQLGEYPLAILYYKRAENLMPRSELIKRNLNLANEKLGLKPQENKGLFDFLLLKPFLSLPERLQIFFVLAVFTLILTSAWLWTKKQWLSNVGVIFLLLLTAAMFNLGLTYYFSPIEGVLINSAELRRDAGKEFAKVKDEPISGGTTVEVTATSPNGKWLKVIIPGGEFGFVPVESVRLVDL